MKRSSIARLSGRRTKTTHASFALLEDSSDEENSTPKTIRVPHTMIGSDIHGAPSRRTTYVDTPASPVKKRPTYSNLEHAKPPNKWNDEQVGDPMEAGYESLFPDDSASEAEREESSATSEPKKRKQSASVSRHVRSISLYLVS